MFFYFTSPRLKVVIAHSLQVDIAKEIEKKFKDLTALSSKDHQALKTFKVQAKSILELIKFSLEKYMFDENVEDTILKLGDSVVSFVVGYTQKNAKGFLTEIVRPRSNFKSMFQCEPSFVRKTR
jgi:hypothetical protein